MKYANVENNSHPLKRPLIAQYCSSFLCQLRGLMFRRILAEDAGLLLVQHHDSKLDAAIHMMFMNFDIAVAWINDAGEVVDVILALRWRPAYFPSQPARYVLEMPVSRLADFQKGDKVSFREVFIDN